MKKRLLTPLLALFLLLSGCTAAPVWDGTTSVPIYRLVTEERQNNGELLDYETVSVPDNSTPILTAVRQLNSPAGSTALVSALPGDVQIDAVSLKQDTLHVWMNETYLTLSGMEQTLVNSCITLTFCALENIHSVTIFSDDRENAVPMVENMTADSILLYGSESLPYEKQLLLYFPDENGEYLRPEFHTLTVDINTPLERYIIEELLRGPYDDSLQDALPSNTILRSISTEDGLCTVDVSSEFLTDAPGPSRDARLTIYSVVNSLTALKEIQRVQFMVEGEPLHNYSGLSLLRPLGPNTAAVLP